MSLATAYSRACVGIDAPLVTVETHLSHGLPAFNLVGLAETAVRESKERVRSAILNSGFDFPLRRITVNLAPADIPKLGTRYDLAIALSILAATEQIPKPSIAQIECLAELALGGAIRCVGGVLPAALATRQVGRAMMVTSSDAVEASLVDGLVIYQANDLRTICEHLLGSTTLEPYDGAAARDKRKAGGLKPAQPDLAEVRGQFKAKRALEIAAAGGHNLLMVGPPGTGKTMLATRLPGILPPLSEKQAFESAQVWSIANQGFAVERWRERPFRAPHHTSSAAAMAGGGSVPRPGEVSLAHNGILFLDELPHFDRRVIEVLREPLESHRVTISRVAFANEFPADFQLVAALNPCPCGYYGDPSGRCICRLDQIERYLQKISGPLLDRIDLQVDVLRSQVWPPAQSGEAESTATVAQRVRAAHDIQMARQDKLNRLLGAQELSLHGALEAAAQRFIEDAFQTLGLSARGFFRVLKVARTIADLEAARSVTRQHIAEALAFRCLDRIISDLHRCP